MKYTVIRSLLSSPWSHTTKDWSVFVLESWLWQRNSQKLIHSDFRIFLQAGWSLMDVRQLHGYLSKTRVCLVSRHPIINHPIRSQVLGKFWLNKCDRPADSPEGSPNHSHRSFTVSPLSSHYQQYHPRTSQKASLFLTSHSHSPFVSHAVTP